MKFNTRKVEAFLDVSITDGFTTFSLGLLDNDERIALSEILKGAIDDLLHDIDIGQE